MIVQFRNEKVSNHGSIPITIDCNVVAFIVFEEGFHEPIKRPKHYSRAFGDEARNFNYGQVTRTVPELCQPPRSSNYHTTPTGEHLSLDRFNVNHPFKANLQRY
ncbi:hypothetical protein TNCV_4525811 [Trichonephila clavipes]|nr:hypothetical protein TNCV_4525811 [Trichonephila clavipes]